jgi:uncharacterized protein YceK
MKTGLIRTVLIAPIALFASGCSTILPRTETLTKSRWNSYAEAQAAFERVVPNETGTNALAILGFDPHLDPNVHVLTYLDIIQRFMPNQSITKEDLDKSVRACIEARERSLALEVQLNEIRTKRLGNAILDILGFKRKTHETGWQFKGLLLINDGLVVYKLSSGEPEIDRYDTKVKPLGPFQELDSTVAGVVKSMW